MKTFTMKVDKELEGLLAELSRKTKKPKSQLIREALFEYRERMRKKELIDKMVKSAKKIKADKEALKDIKELEGTIGDGF